MMSTSTWASLGSKAKQRSTDPRERPCRRKARSAHWLRFTEHQHGAGLCVHMKPVVKQVSDGDLLQHSSGSLAMQILAPRFRDVSRAVSCVSACRSCSHFFCRLVLTNMKGTPATRIRCNQTPALGLSADVTPDLINQTSPHAQLLEVLKTLLLLPPTDLSP